MHRQTCVRSKSKHGSVTTADPHQQQLLLQSYVSAVKHWAVLLSSWILCYIFPRPQKVFDCDSSLFLLLFQLSWNTVLASNPILPRSFILNHCICCFCKSSCRLLPYIFYLADVLRWKLFLMQPQMDSCLLPYFLCTCSKLIISNSTSKQTMVVWFCWNLFTGYQLLLEAALCLSCKRELVHLLLLLVFCIVFIFVLCFYSFCEAENQQAYIFWLSACMLSIDYSSITAKIETIVKKNGPIQGMLHFYKVSSQISESTAIMDLDETMMSPLGMQDWQVLQSLLHHKLYALVHDSKIKLRKVFQSFL